MIGQVDGVHLCHKTKTGYDLQSRSAVMFVSVHRSLRTADSDELPCPPSGDNGGGSTKIRDDRMAKVKHPSNDWVMGMQLSRGSTLPCPHSSATDDAYPADMEVNQQRSIQFTTHL